jgi:hypothetical protein
MTLIFDHLYILRDSRIGQGGEVFTFFEFFDYLRLVTCLLVVFRNMGEFLAPFKAKLLKIASNFAKVNPLDMYDDS